MLHTKPNTDITDIIIKFEMLPLGVSRFTVAYSVIDSERKRLSFDNADMDRRCRSNVRRGNEGIKE